MRFLKMVDAIIDEHHSNMVKKKNGAIFMDPGHIPNARHIVFPGLKQEEIDQYLVSVYRQPFPTSYQYLLRHLNGAELCVIRLNSQNFSFACATLVIYGLPKRPPQAGEIEKLEPFDVRVEDLRRHSQLPNNFLKVASYFINEDFRTRIDMFIDTEDEKVYAYQECSTNMVDSWDNLDDALCDVLARVKTIPLECCFTSKID